MRIARSQAYLYIETDEMQKYSSYFNRHPLVVIRFRLTTMSMPILLLSIPLTPDSPALTFSCILTLISYFKIPLIG